MAKINQLLFFFFILIYITACKERGENNKNIIQPEESDVLVIHNIDSMKKNVEGFLPIPYYGNHNFILANPDTIFYFSYRFGDNFCGTGIDYSKLEFLNLNLDVLQKLNTNSLDTFLLKKIKKPDYDFIVVAVPYNFLKHSAAKTIKEFIRKNKIKRYYFRKWTEEERNVMSSIRKQIPYKQEDYEWRNTEMVYFVPPVLSSKTGKRKKAQN